MAGVTGGARLDRRLKGLGAKLKGAKKLKVGFLGGATYPDGTSVAAVALTQNFGAPAAGIPPRPFFSNMVEEKKAGWGLKLERLLKHTGGDPDAALALMGEGLAGQLRESIIATNEPPLKPETIRRKGFSKPLIDTSTMINSVDWELE